MILILFTACLHLSVNTGEATIWPSYISESRLGRYRSSAVSSDAAPCVSIGRNILESNGTAVDAAIAVLVCMGAHNPHSMGLGGGFLMLYYNRTEQKSYYIDSREVAPRKATENMFQGNLTLSSQGGLSIAVPGELEGYSTAYYYFGGGVSWKELFTPTIKMCRKGIVVGPHLARALGLMKEDLLRYEAISKVFLKNGTCLYKAGERIKMLDLARTLEEISRQGTKALYGPSELADKFMGDLKAAGSIIDRIDMMRYTPLFREPVKVQMRKNTTLHTVSLPGSGALLAFMLSVLDGYPDMDESVVNSKDMAPIAFHRMTETMKFAYAQRSQLEDEDSEEMEKLIKKLTSREYADFVREQISDTRTKDEISEYDIQWDFIEDHGTAHLSLIAPNGDAVSVTSSINQYFGSLVLSPSTGIILNDHMDDFSSPSITNMFGLPPSPRNRIRPGKRPMSSMSPMILVDANGNVNLVLGGNGGTKITSGVMQVAARNLFFGEDMKQSIDAPRIHHQLRPNILYHEKLFPEEMVKNLRRFGHEIEVWETGMNSIIMGINRGEDGYLYANSDYRKGGDVDGF